MKLRKIMTGLLAATMAIGSMVIASSANEIINIDYAQYSDVNDVPIAMGRDANAALAIKDGALAITVRSDEKRGPTFYFEDLLLEEGKTYTASAKLAATGKLAEGSEFWIQLLSDGKYYDDAYYASVPVTEVGEFYDISYTFTYDPTMFDSDLPRIRIRANPAFGWEDMAMSNFTVVEGSGAETAADDTTTADTAEDDTDTAAADDTPATANNTAGNTNNATNASKGSANTGIAGVATIAGLALVAAGAVVVSRKRK